MVPFLAAGETMTDEEYEIWYDQNSVDLTNLEGLEVVEDISTLQWLGDAMGKGGGSALISVPEGYEAYGRIFFPFENGEFRTDDPTSYEYRYRSWAEVALSNNKIPHALMQSASISTERDGRLVSSGPDSTFGSDLIAELSKFTSKPSATTFLIWEGYGNINRKTSARLPLLELPLGRRCFALTGHSDHFVRPPIRIQLCTPSDRAWCYGSDTDLDYGYVACSQECLDAMRENDSIEIYQIDPAAMIWHDSDVINSQMGTTD
jgi:hypothetical protein